MRFFSPHDQLESTQRRLPHWAQDGAVVFITWRTQDSMPKEMLAAWRSDRNRWLMARGIDAFVPGWKSLVQELPVELMNEYHDLFTTRWHGELDARHGACVLRRPEVARIVSDSLLHFHGSQYEMLGFVIMPNHLHLLACFPDKQAMLDQCAAWKRFTANRINRCLGTAGRVWQQDAFDHLVRHEAQYRRLQEYIAENPVRAGLKSGEYLVWRGGKAGTSVVTGRFLSVMTITRQPATRRRS